MFYLIHEDFQKADEAKIYVNKLKNMRLHLTELLNKKIRLELEIKNLKKTIGKKQTDYERNLKVKLQLESNTSLTKEQADQILSESPLLFLYIKEFDKETLEIQKLFENLQEKE
jgi:regulator of replication initiation timing